jgi:hypothetical protein
VLTRGGQVFDTVADSRNEPSFSPAMTGVELLTRPHRAGHAALGCSHMSSILLDQSGASGYDGGGGGGGG